MARVSAADRARRLIALLGRLQDGARFSLDDLAEQLGATPSELATDLETLSVCGIAPYDPLGLVPVLVENGTVEVFGDVPALKGPVRLSSGEAAALAAALQAAGFTAEDAFVARLLTASAASFSAEDVEHIVRTADAIHEPKVYETLARALEENRVVRMEYATPESDEPTCRDVEPEALFAERGAWYLTAWCRRAGAWRTFRVDRVKSAEISEEKFERHRLAAAGQVRAFDAEGLPSARLRFAAGEPFVAREWPEGRLVQEEADGSAIVEVPYARAAWIARRIAARLGRVEVLDPLEVREAVAAVARQERDVLDQAGLS